MPIPMLFLRRLSFAALLPAVFAGVVLSQQTQTPRDQSAVFRISTELVQTGVMVFDKQGRVVEGLKPEQFELRVDGKPVPISFFEQAGF